MKISIVIPLYNQPEALGFTLEGFRKQKTKHEYEIIIVDDGSKESCEYIIKQYDDLKLIYIYQENKGRAAARNAAIPYLDSDITIFNDCDRIPSDDFIETHIGGLEKDLKAICIGCPKEIYISGNEKKRERIRHVLYENKRLARELQYSKITDVLFNERGQQISPLSWLATFSGNLSIYTKAFKNGLQFDENFKSWGLENLEFGYRGLQNGFRLYRIRSAINYHIAHLRGKGFYMENIIMNHKYFYEKYPKKEIELLKAFMLGQISLQTYEEEISGEICWKKKVEKELYNKII